MEKVNFYGKKVLITGASTGIGKALSHEFAKKGAHLVLGCIPEEEKLLSEWAKELESRYSIKTWVFPIDLTEENGPERLFQEVTEKVGDIYALVNNAGTVAYGKFWEIPLGPQAKTIQLNFIVPTKLMHLFLPGMVKRGDGVIYNTSSVSALQPTPFHTVYGATKAAIQSLSQGVRTELRGTGVTICTLNPTYTNTRLLKIQGFPEKLRWYSISGLKTPEWIAQKAIKAFEKKKFMYVPGLWAKFLHIFLIRFSPRKLVDLVAYYGLQGKDKK